ncbi:MAG: DUF3179 domain-containing protein [Chloroflexi bacterium]|nr:DUF3179 domain-containing protein [Chloroflexota bacterium]
MLAEQDSPTSDIVSDADKNPAPSIEGASAPEQSEIEPADGSDAQPVSRTSEVLTEDDRSQRLKQLTSSWDTDWNRHTIAYDEILSGGPPRDGIPSIDNPTFVELDAATSWLAENEPVIALEINGEARAYPIQILTWHEIVNDSVGDVPVAVTFCPLCNSAITFDRRFQDQVFEFGTSGLLRNSDLIMYDRTTESLWQQFTGEGVVGELAGEMLTFIPTSLISFADFRDAYPEGTVLSQDTGFGRSYGQNPYAGYDDINQSPFLFDGDSDGRLRPMERVVTVSLADADVAHPLTTLTESGVIHDEESVTGDKGSGMTEFVLFPPGNGVRIKRDTDGREVSSDSVEAPTDPRQISYDLLLASHYCTNESDCSTFVVQPGCFGHYSWTATFQRNY